MTKEWTEKDHAAHKDHYDKVRFQDWDVQSLKSLRASLNQEIERRCLTEIVECEEKANELRELIGIKRRPATSIVKLRAKMKKVG